jgi:hypothetical protein
MCNDLSDTHHVGGKLGGMSAGAGEHWRDALAGKGGEEASKAHTQLADADLLRSLHDGRNAEERASTLNVRPLAFTPEVLKWGHVSREGHKGTRVTYEGVCHARVTSHADTHKPKKPRTLDPRPNCKLKPQAPNPYLASQPRRTDLALTLSNLSENIRLALCTFACPLDDSPSR